jgi:Protein of unknown function (DUF3616)
VSHKPVQQVELLFSRDLSGENGEAIYRDLSAAALVGDTLFLACDETASVERLSRVGRHRFGDHLHLSLERLVKLPAGSDGEMDIEGLCAADGFLWIVGSHSWKRGKPKRGKTGPERALARLQVLERQPNRYFLGRIPIVEESPGLLRPCRNRGGRHAAWLKLSRRRSALLLWLADDPHLAPFLKIPSKENGFDIEGVAARGDRIWLGLRGPVIGGHAIVLDLTLKEPRRGRLRARRVDGKRRYRKHLLDTDGLGIRDMRFDGDDLLLLVGPTMSLDGPAFVLRWRDAVHDDASDVIDPQRVEKVVELPYLLHTDHPEAVELWPGKRRELLVIYDSPAAERIDEERSAVRADVFTM